MDDYTRKFNVISKDSQTKEILSAVYDALRVKGYDPISQIIGYIVSEDPTYITNYNGARSLICRLDRDELLQELLTSYLGLK
ncbi:MAG: IreB family regulatory phosphoprotein [Oscillospiraceae bacterium]|nr:IreB family regulatory phosphoprotein [Oscillospiraceae bacterium]MCR5174958.1 IreB family regulatory phosphoprotein [Oscillospiraceae bacterium]